MKKTGGRAYAPFVVLLPKTHLLLSLFQGLHPSKDRICIVPKAQPGAFGFKYPVQLALPLAHAAVRCAETPAIAGGKAGKVPVQLRIKIFSVALPQGQTHAEAKHAFYLGFPAISQNAPDILRGIV
ncbi:hypothetical protein SDC9_164155 [bioreactor metagenome]|uniref:Uncharacterized protein n=1 Tax=bioreactor metagenome TaxID=1076179 RepID=A0A645FQT3_9ZZZZ